MAKRTSGSRASSRGALGHESIKVICSECYEEFVFNSGVEGDEIECPVCEHRAARPDDGLLHRIVDLHSAEKKGFIICFMSLLVSVASIVAWVLLSDSPTYIIDKDSQTMLFAGPLGLFALSSMALLVLSWKYESNRWDAYF